MSCSISAPSQDVTPITLSCTAFCLALHSSPMSYSVLSSSDAQVGGAQWTGIATCVHIDHLDRGNGSPEVGNVE